LALKIQALATQTDSKKEQANERLVPSKSNRENLPALTSLRFFATALVLLQHGSELFGFDKRLALTDIGTWQGLTCFFVLSGFILTYCYPELTDDRSIIKFIGARIARIWPSYAMAIILFILAFPSSMKAPGALSYLVANLTMTQAWFFNRAYFTAFNTPSWSLSVEMFFYICFPYFLRSLQTTWLPKLTFSVLLALACIALCTFEQYPNFVAFGSSAPPLVNICPLSRLFEFVLGMSTGMFFLKSARPHISKLKGTVLEFSALALVTLSLFSPRLWQLSASMQWASAIRCWFIYGGVAPAYAALIYALASRNGALGRLLNIKPLTYLGELSFSLFLFHYPVYLFMTNFTQIVQGRQAWFCMVSWLGCTFIASAINFELVEKPCRRRIISALSAVLD